MLLNEVEIYNSVSGEAQTSKVVAFSDGQRFARTSGFPLSAYHGRVSKKLKAPAPTLKITRYEKNVNHYA